MATSPVKIANMALVRLSEPNIASLEEASTAAVYCKAFFDEARDTVLEAHPWRIAMRKQALALLADTEETYGWDYGYALPTDPYCLKARWIDDDPSIGFETGDEHRIFTNQAAAELTYTARVTNYAQWPALLADTVAIKLASLIAYPLTHNKATIGEMEQLLGLRFREARLADARNAKQGLPTEDPWRTRRRWQ